MSESLIQAESRQPELLPTTTGSFFAELELKGEFTGDRLFTQRPDAYKAIVILLGQKMGVIRIGQMLAVSPNTVMAVRDREGASIDIVKQHLAQVAHAGATLASEGILEALNERLSSPHPLQLKDLKDLAVVYGILVQNGQLLAGQPTARVEVHELQRPGHEDFNRYINALPEAKVTHLEGEKVAQKEGEDMPQAVGLIPRQEPGRAPSEVESPAPMSDEEPTQAPAIEVRETQPAPGTDERSEGKG